MTQPMLVYIHLTMKKHMQMHLLEHMKETTQKDMLEIILSYGQKHMKVYTKVSLQPTTQGSLERTILKTM